MRISTLLTLVVVLIAGTGASATAFAADDMSCHFLPMADSSADLRHAQSVGLLYSENTLNTLEYLEHYHSVALNGAKNAGLDPRISAAFVDSSDPQRAINWLTASLQKHFGTVTLYDSLDAVVQARPDVVVMLDTYNQLVTKANRKVEARFIAKFYDANLQYIGKAEGIQAKELPSVWVRGKAAPEIAAQINQQTELQVNALKQFDASLKALVSQGDAGQVATNQ
ncbi:MULTISPECIES: ATPase [Pseudomonas]|uniref:ATPase n=1 Tax=Pseudomonas protegens TaxID=380021 RepID=A0A9Q6N7W6_9PSED|nr:MULTISPECIES: ATPase [Pseudomonas]MBS7561908.1 ATPase [Pseudomonas sp. RC4D1]MBW8354983.1 ATPase [Pseudomonas sp.]MCY7262215.1 ATPase [Pseudomonas protegens]MDD1018714.1 ATPase [Pseudomonas idahonensis]MDP9502219.1 ATPase [Pseudomonas protegens]